MKLSSRVRYGTRAMLDLALAYGTGPVFLKDIARRQQISLKYLDRIFSSLRVARLVRGLRGKHGGYVLALPPQEISVSQIVEALDGPLELVECLSNRSFCRRVNFCVTHDIWSQLGRAMQTLLRSTTLEDLIIRQKKKKRSADPMNYI